jgi:hypothetical protein
VRGEWAYDVDMRTHPTTSRCTVAFSFLLLASCGGSVSSGGNLSSGVDSSKRLTTLTDAERGQLCDWMVPKVGSYGTPPACPGPLFVYPDQAACIEDSADETETDCLATVAQLEACVNQLPACATLADASSTPACAVLLAGC